MKNLKKIKGDASFRNFFRKKEDQFSSIIVYAKKEKFKNLLVYDAINKILNNQKILAPRLYSENYSENYIEIQDFGNQTIFDVLKKKKKKNIFILFKKIIKLLHQIQSIKVKKIKNFKNKDYKIPLYQKNILMKEANLFCDWYLKKSYLNTSKKKFSKDFKKIIKKLLSNLTLKNNLSKLKKKKIL